MSIDMQEKDEEILWQSNGKLYFQAITFLISSVVLVIGIVTDGFFSKLLFSDFYLIMVGIYLFGVAIKLVPVFVIIYTIINWLFAKSLGTVEYFATNKKIVDKSEKKEYIEYFAFEYSKINKIKIQPSFFFKKRGVSIIIFPKFNSTGPLEWRFQFFKDRGVKVPKRLEERYHVLYNVSDYKPLLKILEQYHVKIINK